MSAVNIAQLKQIATEARGYMGCGDNGCLFVKPEGMASNSGCRCGAQRNSRGMGMLANLMKLCASLEETPAVDAGDGEYLNMIT